jgi:hypothetical protein
MAGPVNPNQNITTSGVGTKTFFSDADVKQKNAEPENS